MNSEQDRFRDREIDGGAIIAGAAIALAMLIAIAWMSDLFTTSAF